MVCVSNEDIKQKPKYSDSQSCINIYLKYIKITKYFSTAMDGNDEAITIAHQHILTSYNSNN